MTTINSRDLNYIVYRYLQESGLQHTAFNMGCEASIDSETSIDEKSVPPGALVTLVEKGFRYLEMEALTKIDDKDVGEVFSVVKPLDLLTMSTDEVKQIMEGRKKQEAEKQQKGKEKEVDVEKPEPVKQRKGKAKEVDVEKLKLVKQRKGKEKEVDVARVTKDKQKEKIHKKVNYKLQARVTSGGPEPMDMPTSSPPPVRGVRSSDVLTLQVHTAEVYTCAWNPAGFLLASGSGDSTARIWRIAEKANSSSLMNTLASERVLRHSEAKPNEKRKEVTTLDWNLDGSLLATGSHDGVARIWNANGELNSTFSKHTGPIYSVNWNKKGDYLLTGSDDGSSIVWDMNAYKCLQQFTFHSGAILDVDWRTNHTFASGSTDTMIYVNKIGDDQPLRTFSGHSDEVNCVKWNASGLLLASCSDDMTTKIWSMGQDMPIHDFKDHTKDVYIVSWNPAGPKSDNPNKQLLLASGSFDCTVKVWDPEAGRLLHSLNGHRDSVYTLAFSPDGEYLASGSADKMVNIWSVKESKIIKTYFGNGIVSHVSWNKKGNQIAYSTHKKSVCVSDFRK